MQQNPALQQLVAHYRAQDTTNVGLLRRFKAVYDAVNVLYPPTAAAGDQPTDKSPRTTARNKYVLLLEQLRAAEEAVHNNLPTSFNATKIREELKKYVGAFTCASVYPDSRYIP